jgi:hypothetical protein
LLLLAAVVGAAIFGVPTTARADFVARIYEDVGLPGETFVGTLTSSDLTSIGFGGFSANPAFTTLDGFFKIEGSGDTNFPGDQTGSSMSLSGNSRVLADFGPSGGHHSITIVYSEDGWLLPVGTPITLTSFGGGSAIITGGSGTVGATYQGFLDSSAGNAVYGTPLLFATPAGASTALQSATRSSSGSLLLNPDTAVNPSVPGGVPFTMTTVFTFDFNLAAGVKGSANLSASTIAAVPAPAGIVLALTGLPAFGLAGFLRRRRQAA